MSPDQRPSGASPDLFEAGPHSFIVKIWLEETLAETGRVVWRGHITHVPSGQRCYLKNLSEVAAFIEPYLQRMGVKPRNRGPLTDWLRQLGRLWPH